MATKTVSEEALDELGEEFAARFRRGETPSVDEYVTRYSTDEQAEVRDFLESILLLEELKSGESGASTARGNIPEEFGRYRIQRSLGEGGMGAVYLAHDTQLDRNVALKTPKFSNNSDPKLIDRFYREARSAATLQHPNICPVYDVGEIDGIHYISMAYIEGRPLSDCIRAKKLPPVNSVLRIVRKVALALHEAHQQGLIHRDLKPANIMISRRNEPIVMDFGLARQIDGTADEEPSDGNGSGPSLSTMKNVEARLTLDGTVVGSPGYMSPEQLMGDSMNIGPASDVYALGVVLYELLTRKLPFPGDGTLMSVVNAVLSDDPPDASMIRPQVSKDVVMVCRRALAKNLDERYPSMQAFAVALTQVLKADSDREQPERVSEVTDAPQSPDLVRIREQYELATSLYQEGQFAAAVSILEKMVAGADKSPNRFTRWAEEELPRVREKAEQADRSTAEDFADHDFWNAAVDEDAGQTADFGSAATRRSRRKSRRTPAKSGRRAMTAAVCVAVVLIAVFAVGRFLRSRAGTNKGQDSQEIASTGSSQPRNQQGAGMPDDMDRPAEGTQSRLPADTDPPSADVDTTTRRPDARIPPRNQGGRPGQGGRPNGVRMNAFEFLWRQDANRDGRLSRTELVGSGGAQPPMMRRVLENFDRFDQVPKDEFLNRSEVQMLVQTMAKKFYDENPGGRRPRQQP